MLKCNNPIKDAHLKKNAKFNFVFHFSLHARLFFFLATFIQYFFLHWMYISKTNTHTTIRLNLSVLLTLLAGKSIGICVRVKSVQMCI